MKRHPKGTGIVVVPPMLKYLSGPLLGPALLQGAAEADGHELRVLDLNARYLREAIPVNVTVATSRLLGDHAKPLGLLKDAQDRFRDSLQRYLGNPTSHLLGRDPALSLTYGFDEVDAAAERMADGPEGRWIQSVLRAEHEPQVVGVSILYSGQVVWALAVAIVARRLWPDAVVLAGGPHVTALAPEIARDARYGRRVGGFVFGHAERTIADCLAAAAGHQAFPPEVVAAGSGAALRARGADVEPVFEDLEFYGLPHLSIPAQTSVGCPYGRCGFCTYPRIEGAYRNRDVRCIESAVQFAMQCDGAVALKDSLVLPPRLDALAGNIRGRVAWSACTKIDLRLDARFLSGLKEAGCGTLEVGIETLVPDIQTLINKQQRPEVVCRFLDAAADAGMPLVLNYITAFPGEDPEESIRWLDWLREQVGRRPSLTAHIEENRFQLERRALLSANPRVRVVERWPWASVLAWEWTSW